jgi:hypothetical protein
MDEVNQPNEMGLDSSAHGPILGVGFGMPRGLSFYLSSACLYGGRKSRSHSASTAIERKFPRKRQSKISFLGQAANDG